MRLDAFKLLTAFYFGNSVTIADVTGFIRAIERESGQPGKWVVHFQDGQSVFVDIDRQHAVKVPK